MDTPIVSRLKSLHAEAEAQATELAATLQAISEQYWCGCEDAPLFRLIPETKTLLRDVQVMIAAPISEIECAE